MEIKNKRTYRCVYLFYLLAKKINVRDLLH